ncbi:hypothetical protein CSO01_14390 [Cellulomonas soli]|uniref:Uncharacterized protein n=1 Tax=Cellulomonas soli TaxID=931535 RepID=A0A512PBZ1_9CELL|nr:hypothetical protein CSO01_14390 [Cellulomonas soli]
MLTRAAPGCCFVSSWGNGTCSASIPTTCVHVTSATPGRGPVRAPSGGCDTPVPERHAERPPVGGRSDLHGFVPFVPRTAPPARGRFVLPTLGKCRGAPLTALRRFE